MAGGGGRRPQPVGDAPRGGKSKATVEAKERFLLVLAECGSIAGSARAIGYSRRAVRDWRKDPAFAERWDAALEQATGTLEREAWRRAVEGVEENQVSGGKVVSTVRRYSDSLLALLLRAHAPEKYGAKAGLAVQMRTPGSATFTFRFEGDGLGPVPGQPELPAIEGKAEGAGLLPRQ